MAQLVEWSSSNWKVGGLIPSVFTCQSVFEQDTEPHIVPDKFICERLQRKAMNNVCGEHIYE